MQTHEGRSPKLNIRLFFRVIRDPKLETENAKFNLPARKAPPAPSGRAFYLSGMAFRFSTLLPLSLVIVLIVLGTACNRNQPSSESESEPKSPTIRETQRSDVALRIRSAVKRAGGGEIWIKRYAKGQQGRNSEATMRVVATSAGYHAVLSALRQEARTNGLVLSRGEALRDGHRITVFHLTRKSQPVFRMELREVPRLMRASIVIDDVGADLQAAHRLLDLDYPLTYSVLPYLRYSREAAEEAHHDGREVMLHLPWSRRAADTHLPVKAPFLLE